MPMDWFQGLLVSVRGGELFGDEPPFVRIAEIRSRDRQDLYFRSITGLATKRQEEWLQSNPDGIGNEPSTSGPHPTPFKDAAYNPRLEVWLGSGEGAIEPLVIGWQTGAFSVLAPTNAFLMTYGLIPRLIATGQQGEIHWDDRSVPQPEIVRSRVLALSDWPRIDGAYIDVRRDYLLDYATLRAKYVVQGFLATSQGPMTPSLARRLRRKSHSEVDVGRLHIRLNRAPYDEDLVYAEITGFRVLARPGMSPVTAGRSSYGQLKWPGRGRVSEDRAMSGIGESVCVSDSVLEQYEGRDGFEVFPEHGSVHYGGQWAVSYCSRIGRDTIAVELKKLYEGAPPAVVKHWNQFAVRKPRGAWARLRAERNVAMRSRRIVTGLRALADALARAARQSGWSEANRSDFVDLDFERLDYEGWWKEPNIEMIARHIPLDLKMDAFLERIGSLNKAVVEALRTKGMRKLVRQLGLSDALLAKTFGVPRNRVQGLGSIKLLGACAAWLQVAEDGSYSLSRQRPLIRVTWASCPEHPAAGALSRLNRMRQLVGHRKGAEKRTLLLEALQPWGVHDGAVATGWGRALDRVYDQVGDALFSMGSLR